MARVVCQVLSRPDRLTLIWSEGDAYFEPYHLTAAEVEDLSACVTRTTKMLADQPETAQSGQIGVELYQRLFLMEQAGTGEQTREIRQWLAGLEAAGSLESIEILSDAPELVPWNLVCDRPEGEDRCWGTRLNLAVGRRTDPLRQIRVLENPEVLLAIDPGLEKNLPADQARRLEEFLRADPHRTVRSREELRTEMRERAADVLYLFCRAEKDGFRIGDDIVTARELRDLVRGIQDGEPMGTTFLVLNPCRDGAGAVDVLAALQGVGLTDFVAPALALPAERANALGLDLLAGFLHQGEPLGSVVQRLRARTELVSQWYTVVCSPELRVVSSSGIEEDGGSEDSAPETLALPDAPYRPLAPYDMEDRPLFVGRDADVERFSELLDQAGTRLAILHGPSGVGKASLLRAGVIPYLEEDCVGYRLLRDRSESDEDSESDEPVLAIRATHNLPGQLAQALCAFCARPYSFLTPTGRSVVVDLPAILAGAIQDQGQGPSGGREPSEHVTAQGAHAPRSDTPPERIEGALREDSELLARLLTVLSERLPYELVLIIEQMEEAVAQVKESTARQAAGMLHQLLAHPGHFKVVVSLRTEFFGQLSAHLQPGEHGDGAAGYLLRGLDEEVLTEAILQPTAREPIPYADEIPFEKYGFAYDEGLAREIARTALRVARDGRHSAASLVQAACAQLAEIAQTRGDHVVHQADLKKIGGVEGALDRYVGLLVDSTTPLKADRRALRRLLPELVARQPGGLLSRPLVRESVLDERWKGASRLANVVDAAADENIGLLDTIWLKRQGRQERFISLSQDALLPVADRWAEEKERQVYARKRVVDTLFVTIPLILLAAVFAFLRYNWYRAAAESSAEAEQQLAQNMQVLKSKEETLKSARWTGYVARLAQARQAWEAGNLVAYDQALRACQDVMKDESDLRGFEWYYLWSLGHSERATLAGHQGLVTSVAVSPDSKLIATASQDGTVKLWDAASGRQRATLTAPEGAGKPDDHSPTLGRFIKDIAAGRGPVNAVAFSGDGLLVACGDANGIIRLWDLRQVRDDYFRSEKPTSVLRSFSGPIRALAFAPDSKTLAAGGADRKDNTETNVIRLWDVTDLKETKTLTGHNGPIHALAYGPGGKVLASGSEDRTVILWDPAKGEKKKTLEAHSGPVYAVAFSTDGKTLASGGRGRDDGIDIGTIVLWDPETGKERSSKTVPAGVLSLAFLPEVFLPGTDSLVVGMRDNAVQVWAYSDDDISTGHRHFKGHVGWVDALAVSADGKTLVTGSYDGTAKVWDLTGPTNPQVLSLEPGGPICSLAMRGPIVAIGNHDTINLYNTISGETSIARGHTGAVLGLALSPRGDLLASGSWDEEKDAGKLLVRELRPGKEPLPLKGHAKGIASVAFSSDGRILASGGTDGKIILWDPATRKKRYEIAAHKGIVRCLAFSPEGNLLASGGDDTRIRLWDAATGTEHPTRDPENKAPRTAPLEEHTAAVLGLAFSPDMSLASASADTTVKLWDVGSGTSQITLRGHNGPVFSVSFSPGGETLASAGRDGTVKLWDANRGTERFTLTGHSGAVRAVAFSPDRQLLASGGHDGTIRLWRAAPPEPAMMVPPAD